MDYLRVLLLTSLFLLPASHVWADEYSEMYSAKVCNKGQIIVDVATAYKDDDLFKEYWVIERWKHVAPGACETVFAHSYPTQMKIQAMLGSLKRHPVHLAFAFRDSAGVWGAAKVKPPDGTAASHLQLCVYKDDNSYRVDDKDPAAACAREAVAFLIPASIDYEPDTGDPCTPNYLGSSSFSCASMTFTVALGPNDRAIPLGSQRPASASAPTGAIPKPFGQGTQNAVFLGKKIVAWNSRDDQRWYSDDGSFVLKGAVGSPLFDVSAKTGGKMQDDDARSLEQLVLEILQEEEVTKSTQTHYIVLSSGPRYETRGRACFASEGRLNCANYHALDFGKAKVFTDSTDAGRILVDFPCRADALCVIKAPGWGGSDAIPKVDFFGEPRGVLPQSSFIVRVASEESGRTLVSRLAEIARIFAKYQEPARVESVGAR